MAQKNTTGNENENSSQPNDDDHILGKEKGLKDGRKNAAGKTRKRNWFSTVFKRTAFTIWAVVMVVGVTLAFIASLFLL